jgi:hypothetical protein
MADTHYLQFISILHPPCWWGWKKRCNCGSRPFKVNDYLGSHFYHATCHSSVAIPKSRSPQSGLPNHFGLFILFLYNHYLVVVLNEDDECLHDFVLAPPFLFLLLPYYLQLGISQLYTLDYNVVCRRLTHFPSPYVELTGSDGRNRVRKMKEKIPHTLEHRLARQTYAQCSWPTYQLCPIISDSQFICMSACGPRPSHSITTI